MLLIVEERRQEPEEQLTEAEKQKNKNSKSPTCANSLRAQKDGFYQWIPGVIHRRWAIYHRTVVLFNLRRR